MFRSEDGGESWQELAGLRGHSSGPKWAPGAGGMGVHTILLDRTNPERIFVAISAAGVFRTDDGGTTWRPINQGLRSQYIPDPRPVLCRHAQPSVYRGLFVERSCWIPHR